jgi:hypothetical protein
LKRITLGQISLVVFVIAAIGLGVMLSRISSTPATVNEVPGTNTPRPVALIPTLVAEAPTATKQVTLTITVTLRPPPTLEPPTKTVAASATPLPTLSPTLNLNVTISGLSGFESATPTGGVTCTPRKDWKLTYTIQRNDALVKIAALYNTNVDDIVKGNCLANANTIIIGQVIKVPGTSQPNIPSVDCSVKWEILTPIDQTQGVAGGGSLTFDWRGPRSPHVLLRIIKPDGSKFEDVFDLRQNDSVDAYNNLPAAGWYTWYVYPLDNNYQQVCPEGGPWHFLKAIAPTATNTAAASSGVTKP